MGRPCSAADPGRVGSARMRFFMKNLRRAVRRGLRRLSRPSGEVHLPSFLDQLDYPVRLEPRYGYGKAPHEGITRELERREGRIAEQLGPDGHSFPKTNV